VNEAPPPLAGVVGWPIGHSRSPRLHGHWLRRHRIAGHYVPLGVRPEDLAGAFAALPKLGFRGVNVTIPHKEAALALAAEATDRAREIGAANTLTFRPDGGFAADNTDGYGFVASLRQGAPGWTGAAGPALVLGAGGAARGVVAALLADGAPEVRVANRTRARTEALRAHFGARVVAVDWAEAAAAVAGAATIVNTTSLGMPGGNVEAVLDLGAAQAHALVTDVVYTPLETPLIAAARARGLVAVDGLGMLLHQAVPGFERWFGVSPEVDDDLRAVVLSP
jgi:shikimate dehydrogenase